jgi:transposase
MPLVASRNGGEKQRIRIRQIWNKAHLSIGCKAHEAARFEALLLMEGLQKIQTVIRATDKAIENICVKLPEYHCLLSIPGFGPDISAMSIGTIGNPERFENTRQVLKTAGLDLSSNKSGKSMNAPYVISKRGKANLRYALYQAAMIASTRNEHFMRYFTGKLAGRERERGIKTKMRVKLAAKMLIIAWTLMKKKEVFDPGYITV